MSAETPGPTVTIDVVLASHRGLVRPANEDAVGVGGWVLTAQEALPLAVRLRPGASGVVVAVADGMGGHRGGAEASRAALTALDPGASDLSVAVAAAAESLRTRGEAEPGLEGMGTTLVGVRIRADGTATFFNVGDSRAYRLVEGYLGQVSVDDRPAVATPANRGVVTQHLGAGPAVALDPHVHEAQLVHGDRLLLCSDGLHDMVDDDRIAACLRLPALEAVPALVAAALDAGGEDNVSVVLVDVR